MKPKTWRDIVITILVLLFLASAIVNVVFARNFEAARKAHVDVVIHQVLWMHNRLHMAAYSEDSDTYADIMVRVFRRAQIQEAQEGLGVALRGLYNHHNGRHEGVGFFWLNLILEDILMQDDDPTIALSEISRHFGELSESLESGMPTQELLDAIRRTRDEIDDNFKRRP